MERPLYVTITTGSVDDVVTVDNDERTGLSRFLPMSYQEKTFGELIDYMVQPSEQEVNDDYTNPALTDSEQNLADIIKDLSQKNVKLYPKQGSQYSDAYGINLEDTIDTHFDQIVRPSQATYLGETTEYKAIDLRIVPSYVGG